MNWISNMENNFEQMKSDLAELIKDDGYEKYYTGKTVEEKAEGMLKVIEGCWIRESIFMLTPVSLDKYRRHYLSANRNYWDKTVMLLLIERYGTVDNPRIKEGYRSWMS